MIIIKESVEEFKRQFTFLGENNEKYITLSALKLQKLYPTNYNLL